MTMPMPFPQSCAASGGVLADGGPRKTRVALPATDNNVAAALAALDGREVGSGPCCATGLANSGLQCPHNLAVVNRSHAGAEWNLVLA